MRYGAFVSLILSCAIFLCGCGGVLNDDSSYSNYSDTPEAEHYNMHLLYDQTDSFNPYTASSKQNKELCQLLYDPLLTLDQNFMPVMKIASSVIVKDKTCTINLKSVKFSDGTALTADDVVYSIKAAMSEGSNYKTQLESIASVEAAGITVVSLKLKKDDPYFANLLDFPIIKQHSDTKKSDDNLLLPPTGCGRYVLNDTKNALEYNPLYYGEECSVKKIGLINAPDGESADHYISSGSVTMCYDDYSDNSVPRMSGLKKSVPLNNLVFVGINMQNPFLRDKYFRYAVSSAINRQDIVKDAYYGNGIAANGPFNPVWSVCEGLQTLENTNNNKIAIVNLEKIGYNSVDSEGYRLTSTGKRIGISLLINSDNQARVAAGQLIVRQLAAVGIEVTLKAVPYEQYLSLLSAKSFDMYLAETKILNNMDLSQLVVPGGSMAFGIVASTPPADTANETSSTEDGTQPSEPVSDSINLTASSAVSGFYEGTYTLSDVVNAFLSEMPIIPVCYRSGVAMYSPKLETEPICTANDLFYNINNYSFNK